MFSESSTINVIPICTIWRLHINIDYLQLEIIIIQRPVHFVQMPTCTAAHCDNIYHGFLKKRSSHFSAKRLALSASFSTKQWTDVNLIILLRPLFSAKQLVSRHKLPKCFVPGMQISSATRLPVSVCICVFFFL